MNTALKLILILVLSPIGGCLFAGIDRKITARLQGRQGPPILQPLYDVAKLLSKENIAVNKYQNMYILFYLIFMIVSTVMLFFGMDLLMIVFVFTIANVALIVGSMTTGSPFAKLGSQREIMAMLAYEPVLIFLPITIYMLTGSFTISSLDKLNAPLIAKIPLIFIAMLIVMLIKFKKSPFDYSASHHAHQELVKGMLTEYSGPTLALYEITHWFEAIFLLGLMFIFWKTNIFMGLTLATITSLFVIIVDNISARTTWDWMVKLGYTLLLGLTLVNVLVLYIQRVY